MKRRTLLKGITVGGALLAAPSLLGLERAFAQQTGAKKRPNIIFILADDWGWGDLGCYGHPRLRTPHLDKMAAQGTLWTSFYANATVCGPSRAAFMTGRFPGELGAPYLFAKEEDTRKKFGTAEFLDPKLPNVSQLLKNSGYATAHFGKWHLGDSKTSPSPSAYGFDEAIGFVSNDPTALDVLGKTQRPFASKTIIDNAIRFLGQNRDKPVYLNLWLLDTHAKLEPTKEQTAAYPQFPEGSARRIYYSAATDSDAQIGRLLDYLDKEGLSNDTLVVFSSDNGPEDPSLFDYGVGSAGPFRGRKRSLYEGGPRVPFIARMPGTIPAGRVDNDTVLSAVDWLPTVCALAGVAMPAGAKQNGQNMSASLRGQSVARQNPLFWEWRYFIHGDTLNRSPQLAMREGNWKLLMNPDRTRIELYDLKSDPSETDNLAIQNPAIVARMQPRLLAWSRSLPQGPHDASAGAADYPWPRAKATPASSQAAPPQD